MSVETVLSKITAHNGDVLGCVASSGGRVYSNLPELYELVDAGAVSEYASIMFEATDALETEHDDFNQMFLEYGDHSLYARRLDDGVLVLVNKPIERTSFKKMQIGVNLFMKPLKRALSGPEQTNESRPLIAEGPDLPPAPGPGADSNIGNPITPTKRKRWI